MFYDIIPNSPHLLNDVSQLTLRPYDDGVVGFVSIPSNGYLARKFNQLTMDSNPSSIASTSKLNMVPKQITKVNLV